MKKRIVILFLVFCIIAAITIIVLDIKKGHDSINQKPNEETPTKVEPTLKKRRIAIIDTGVNLNELDYNKELIVKKYNVIDGSEDISDSSGRGTILYSALYNKYNSMNLSNEVIIIKAFENVRSIDGKNIVKALEYAKQNNAQIINLTTKLPQDDNITKAINDCFENDIPIIVSQKSSENLVYPATLDSVISVSRTIDKQDTSVKVDTTNQLYCFKKVCKASDNIDLSATYVTGYLSKYENIAQAFENLVLKPGYQIEKVEKKEK